jgi:hypothetical protein
MHWSGHSNIQKRRRSKKLHDNNNNNECRSIQKKDTGHLC